VAAGGSDLLSRLVAHGLTPTLGQQVIVDNRGRGTIPSTAVSRAAPDGYTLLVHNTAVWIAPFFLKTPPYDPIKDLAPIALLARAPSLLVVHPSLPVRSVKELIALAKAKPGELNFSSGANGDISHLAGELFKSMAGINIVRIPYATSSVEGADLVSGQVQMTFSSPGSVGEFIKSGRLRALAVGSPQPSALFPQLPTVASAVPGFQTGSIYGIWAPAKTPEAIVKRLNQEVVRFINTPETKQQLLTMQLDAVGGTPEQFAAVIKTEMARVEKLIKDTGITAE
jgi:tripartite-type tricarboxylate transporter receptor subunit TctC